MPTSRMPFHKKLFYTITSLFAGFVLTVFLFQYNREKEFRKQILNSVLQDYNSIINKGLSDESITLNNVDSVISTYTKDSVRITILDLLGNVLFDNGLFDVDTLKNHISRPEIKQALINGAGYALRKSETFGKSYFYASHKFDRYIIRTSLPFNSSRNTWLKIDSQFIYFLIISSLLVIITLSYFCAKLGKSISLLQDFSEQAQQGKPLNIALQPSDNDIGDITSNIFRIYQYLLKTKEELSIEKEKLLKHLQFSKEGLAIFTENKEEIFANNLFIQYINIIADREICSLDYIFGLPDFEKIAGFINRAHLSDKDKKEYINQSSYIHKNGKSFQIECIVFQDNTIEIAINNITQQEEENRLKRQLTQNIAHELKTPVSSIQGYMETIISNPDLQEDKRKQFLERCYAQTIRLTGLLHDISLLNRLDESNDLFDLSTVNLSYMIHDTVSESDEKLKNRKMLVNIDIPDNLTIKGNHSLLYSIFRNLLDNAIAYAGIETSISIKCYRQDNDYLYFSFSDTGIGVPEEHLNRLFERFYRIDKGRSRKLGGTGLGLAIVKNAVLFHKGEISAKNRISGGLEFLFTLKKS
ncbi:MAG: two-component sensor histidine kinase [Bacteroidaceae bacterium]|nr:two-component sensor histidine kinase [Bacteroidaceae bacterium]